MTVIDDDVEEELAGYPVARTNDISQATEVLERILPRVPVRMRTAIPATAFDMHMNAVDVGSLTTSYVRFGSAVHVITSATDSYYVNIPLVGNAIFREGRHVVHTTPGVAGVFSPTPEADLVWDGGCAQICLLIPRSSIERELERHLGHTLGESVEFDMEMDLTSLASRGWLDALRLVLNEADRSNGRPLHPLTIGTLENLLVDSLLVTQRHNYSQELEAPAASASPRAVRAAIELLQERPAHPWTVGELAGSVHLSVRALQDAFAKSTGTSPMRYLRGIRLARVHAELLSGAPSDVTVTEVASRWGFIHHGHFAAAYRAKFGEVPGHTLRLRSEP
ncbi:AraC family transcriptional regulator [Pseudonocardia spinosispora]|uniref:AraC family transcriptional regulator n=1 Tax=Pseudonocardia spinosispora TaxID=103441 RepID=UPI000416515F|nr:AraC family transcriptional regulator [Pseudonocardia spinosispora]